MAAPAIPALDITDDEARARVLAASPALAQLVPGAPGMSCETWQELAQLAGPPPADDVLTIRQWLEGEIPPTDPRVEKRPWSPDIRWLGVIVEPGGHTNDYEDGDAHPHATNLCIGGHRKRFGEKALKHGGIDFAIRTLECFPNDLEVGYHGVLDLFKSAKDGPASLLRHLPKLKFFLSPTNFDTYVAPRLHLYEHDYFIGRCGRKNWEPPTAQQIADTLLSTTIDWSFYHVEEDDDIAAITACRVELGAQLTVDESAYECKHIANTIGGWGQLLHWKDDCHSTTCARLLHAVLKHGGTFPGYARETQRCTAENLVYHLNGMNEADAGVDAREIGTLCIDRLAFSCDGLRYLARKIRGLKHLIPKINLTRDRDALGMAVGVRGLNAAMPGPHPALAFALVYFKINERLRNWA